MSQLPPRELRGIRREVFRLAWPVVLQQFLRTLTFFVDTFMVARLGNSAVAAMGVVGPVSFTVTAFLAALGVGTIATVSRSTGEEDPAKRAQDAATSLGMALAVGSLASVLGWFFLPQAAEAFGVPGDPEVARQAKGYLAWLGAAQFFLLVEASATGILRAAGDTRTPLVIGAFCQGVHIAANYALIFGKLGAPALGVTGAGIATAGALALQALLTVGWLVSPWSRLRLRAGMFAQVSRASASRLLRVTLPAAVEPLILQSGFLVYLKAVTSLGTESLAAHRAAITVESISFLPAYGLAIACSALVGQSLGARRPSDADAAVRESGRLAIGFMCATGAVFALFSVPLVRLVAPGDEAVIGAAALCLVISALEQPFLGLAMTLGGALRGAGDTRSPLVVAAVGVWGVRVPLAYALAFPAGLGLPGIWITMIADWAVRFAVFFWIVRRGKWKAIRL